ncbi:pyruvate/2-oxoglutarate dehydrogenase complex dihydrolipoamide acyltransferase (E2) component [Pseudarthrobacter sp. SLBN-100]
MRKDIEAVIHAPERVSTGSTTETSERVSTGSTTETAGAPGSRQARSPETTDARTGLAIASRTPVRGVRKAVAANMSRSRSEIPEATVWVDVDATALVELREELKASRSTRS